MTVMKHRSFIISLMLGLLTTMQLSATEVEWLKQFRWEQRIILVKVAKGNSRPVVDTLKAAQEDIKERAILWFVIDGPSVVTNYQGEPQLDLSIQLSNVYYAEEHRYGVCLIGKDGGLKHRQKRLDLDELFRRIDAMPMRRAEMRSMSRD
ncbi:Unannotated [Lentimonas sp. CC4]|nr:Unannotated [Lentimonas sp. CC4]CAA6684241.1 Unannotated [Lentimonas sp. CC6]CAA7076385.1 Unannotated [Lentimonas sp. CC4]CAA7171811.1 Unannotated [Lentimonas sp. CC21]CAA7183141.1 Unannotated [Lentimonas sp. CC8]